MKESVLREKSYKFALRTVRLNRYLIENKREFVISKQMLRSGTSIGANVVEGGRAESKPDFIHKLSVALKESFETEYWLSLLRDGEYLTNSQSESMIADCVELQKLLTASIKTAKNSLSKA